MSCVPTYQLSSANTNTLYFGQNDNTCTFCPLNDASTGFQFTNGPTGVLKINAPQKANVFCFESGADADVTLTVGLTCQDSVGQTALTQTIITVGEHHNNPDTVLRSFIPFHAHFIFHQAKKITRFLFLFVRS